LKGAHYVPRKLCPMPMIAGLIRHGLRKKDTITMKEEGL
jgi:hypothetical protein